MATRTLAIRRTTLPSISRRQQQHYHQQRRPFLSSFPNPLASPQTLSASRTLPYDTRSLYAIIADVPSYSRFLPYCIASSASEYHQTQAQSFPRRGSLTVGFGPVTASYTSRLYCIPNKIVEAISGDAIPTLTRSELASIGLTPAEVERERREDVDKTTASGGMFTSLVTRWTVTPTSAPPSSAHRECSAVELNIRYRFANPMYQAASGKFSEEIAGLMVEAFEKRARELLGGGGEGKGARLL